MFWWKRLKFNNQWMSIRKVVPVIPQWARPDKPSDQTKLHFREVLVHAICLMGLIFFCFKENWTFVIITMIDWAVICFWLAGYDLRRGNWEKKAVKTSVSREEHSERI